MVNVFLNRESKSFSEFLTRLNQELDVIRDRVLGRKPLPFVLEMFLEDC